MSKKKKDEAVESTEEVVTAEEAAGEQPEEKDEKEEKIKALEQEVAAGKERYLRLAAEYENYRKRTANEKLSLYDDATSKAVKELLPVADSVRMALENLKDADPEILKGVELISNQLDKSFEKLKIEAFGKVGDDFDPNLHNAIGMVDNEELGSGKLAAVYQTGYKIGDKIIRHAMVQVTN
ncbi:MAG: nucleotide exchange factor GrpE [Ruminococcus sp.]|nr:nucleotide exchange factor GrpE [Ruminococcus sp.]